MKRLLLIAALVLAACQGDGSSKLEPVGTAAVDAQRAACEKRGGNFALGGSSGGFSCITTPRDAGKQCKKATDCESACLARSNTCAPLQPLFGCNEILTATGVRLTQCVN